jgi:hypothetical protein
MKCATMNMGAQIFLANTDLISKGIVNNVFHIGVYNLFFVFIFSVLVFMKGGRRVDRNFKLKYHIKLALNYYVLFYTSICIPYYIGLYCCAFMDSPKYVTILKVIKDIYTIKVRSLQLCSTLDASSASNISHCILRA